MIWLLALQLTLTPQQLSDSANRDLVQKNLPRAEQEVEAALAINPYFVPALVLKARIAIFAHRPDVSRSCLIKAVTADPSSQDAQFYLGVFYYLQNEFKLALPPLQVAASLAPNRPMPPFYLAMSQEALGNASEAQALYQQAENLSPGKSLQRASILVAYGRSLFATGKYKESILKDRLAIESDEQSRDAHYELAKGLNHEGEFKAAAAEGERALTFPDLGTSDSQIHFLLGGIFLKLGEPDMAKAHIEKFKAAPQSTRR